MSESFHLTKSLLSRLSPVSLHLCQGPFHVSEHFNDIWCWDRGREQREGHGNPAPSTAQQNTWGGPGREPEAEDPGETWSSRAFSSSLTSPTVTAFPTQRKSHFLRVSLPRMLTLLCSSILDLYIVATRAGGATSHTQGHSLALP